MPDRLMLLDTSSLYFRAFHGVPESITAADGTPVNAVRGLLDFIARLVTDRGPARLVACLDADWRPAFRVAALPAYKAHRVAPEGGEIIPDGLRPQVPIIDEVLDALGLARLGVPGYEADDVIGTLTHRADGPVDVVTGDRDLFQLIDDRRGVRILYTAGGVGKHAIVDEAAVTERYNIPGRAYADFALLRGDPSDGLPGVPGVGERTAAILISRYGDADGVRAAADDPKSDLTPAVRRKLLAASEYLAAAPVVVRVATDVPVPGLDDRLPTTPRDPDALAALVERWALSGPAERVVRALAGAAT